MKSKFTKQDIALQLSQITGKPVEEFLDDGNKQISGSSIQPQDDERPRSDEQDVYGTRSTNGTSISVLDTNATKDSRVKRCDIFETEYVNGRVIGGRQMTRKEYLQEIKGKTKQQIMDSIYLHKMFRSEGQREANFVHWMNSFPEEDDE